MISRPLVALCLGALATLASAQESTLPAASTRHDPQHLSAKALHRALHALAERHGDGLNVRLDGEHVVVLGLPEDVEAMQKVILLIDLPPIQPVATHSVPQELRWEGEAIHIVPLHDDVEREKLQGWLTRMIGFHPTARSVQIIQLADVRRLLIVGTPAEITMASAAAEILLEAYHAGLDAGDPH